MELLKEAVPQAALFAILWNANDHGMTLRYREIEKAARVLRVEVQALGLRKPEDFAGAFASMTRRRPDAMSLVADVLTTMNRKRLEDQFREAARYIDRILKGAKPADLPAVQPARYYLAVNLKTATTLGLTIPPSLHLRTDELVQ